MWFSFVFTWGRVVFSSLVVLVVRWLRFFLFLLVVVSEVWSGLERFSGFVKVFDFGE